jgi:ribonuclease P protein component
VPRYEPLRGEAEFARIRRRGRRIRGAHVAVVAVPSAGGRPRVGITTAHGFGDAVDRNRARRRLRAALAGLEPPGKAFDMILTARDSALTADFAGLADDLRMVLARLASGGGR